MGFITDSIEMVPFVVVQGNMADQWHNECVQMPIVVAFLWLRETREAMLKWHNARLHVGNVVSVPERNVQAVPVLKPPKPCFNRLNWRTTVGRHILVLWVHVHQLALERNSIHLYLQVSNNSHFPPHTSLSRLQRTALPRWMVKSAYKDNLWFQHVSQHEWSCEYLQIFPPSPYATQGCR